MDRIERTADAVEALARVLLLDYPEPPVEWLEEARHRLGSLTGACAAGGSEDKGLPP